MCVSITDVLIEQLYDKRLYKFWRDHSIMYHPSATERMMDIDDNNPCIVSHSIVGRIDIKR